MTRPFLTSLSLAAVVCGFVFAADDLRAANSVRSKSGKIKKTVDKATCTKRELAQKNCRLWVGETKLNLLKENWRFNDGLWLGVHPLPLTAADTQWEQVALSQFGQRRFLQLWIWSSPMGEAAVQDLNWYVLELGETDAPVRVQEPVQRRRRVERPELSRQPAAGASFRFNYDPREKTVLKSENGQIQWSAGRRHGEF